MSLSLKSDVFIFTNFKCYSDICKIFLISAKFAKVWSVQKFLWCFLRQWQNCKIVHLSIEFWRNWKLKTDHEGKLINLYTSAIVSRTIAKLDTSAVLSFFKVLLTGNVWFGHVPPDNEKLHKKRWKWIKENTIWDGGSTDILTAYTA